MPRLVYLSGVGLALVALAFVATEAALGPRPGVTAANVERIRPGMPLADVEALLGGKARVGPAFHLWVSDSGEAVVRVGADGRAEWAAFLHGPLRPSPPQPGPLARLRAWLGW
jgi:hypothetical protein